MLREGALAGLGPTLQPDWLLGSDVDSGALVDLFPQYAASTPESPATAWASYPSRRHVPARVRMFIEFLRSTLGHGPDGEDA